MEIARKPIFRATWNGKDITTDLSNWLSSIEFVDHEEGMSDELSIIINNDGKRWLKDLLPNQGDIVTMAIGYAGDLFDCGTFEVDEIEAQGPPDTISAKCIASGFAKEMRTRNSKAFDSQTLYQIASFFAKKYRMTVIDQTGLMKEINIERKTQELKTDLSFLSEIAKEYGFIFSIRGDKMLFTEYAKLDEAEAIADVYDKDISSYDFSWKLYDTYSATKVVAHNKKKNKTVKKTLQYAGEAPIESIDTHKSSTSGSASQINRKAYAGLWDKNKFSRTCNIDMEGSTRLEASKNINICGFGAMSGKYHIMSSTHTISDGAYTTRLEMRLTGTVPAAKKVPAAVKVKKKKEPLSYADDGNEEEEGTWD